MFFFPVVKVPEMARPISSRSQDDAMVSYIFQRPQTDGNFQAFSKHQSRWLGDESISEVTDITISRITNEMMFIDLLLYRSSLVLPMMLHRHQSHNQVQSTASNGASLIRYI